jgi:hypothetical protein
MEQITIDFKNAFDCSKKEKSKVCRSGYVRLVRFMDDKKHTRPQVYEGDLLEAIMDVKREILQSGNLFPGKWRTAVFDGRFIDSVGCSECLCRKFAICTRGAMR